MKQKSNSKLNSYLTFEQMKTKATTTTTKTTKRVTKSTYFCTLR